jgi:hypothetical protein
MSHARRNIRDAAVQALTGLPTTGANVHATRLYPMEPAGLPALCIYTLSEESGFDSLPPRKLLRRLELAVEIVGQVNETLDDTLDQISLEVEQMLGTNFTLGGTAKDCELQSTKITVRGEGEKQTGSAVLIFGVTYRTLATDAATLA